MKSIKAKILIGMVSTVAVSLLVISIVSICLNINSTNRTLEQSMLEAGQLAAGQAEWELRAYSNIACEIGGNAKLTDPQTVAADKESVMKQKADSYGLKRGDIIGKDGISLISGRDYSDKEYFRQAMEGKSYVSEPLPADDGLEIAIAAPLWLDGNENTSVEGAIVLIPKENFLNEIVVNVKVSPNASAYLINKAGTTIAHMDFERVKKGENIEALAKSNTALEALARIHEKMRQGKSDFASYTFAGVSKFVAYAPIAGTDGWSIAINAPTSDFMSATVTGIIITVVLLIASVLAAILIAFLLANGIGRPIKICTDRLELLASGDLKSPVVTVKNRDETGRLSDSTERIVTTVETVITDMSWGLGELAKGDFTVDSQKKDKYVGDFLPLAASMYKIIEQMTDALREINFSADRVATGSEQVSVGAQALSQGATEQAASVEELAATITGITGQIKSNAEDAEEASRSVEDVSNKMVDSNDKMQQMIKAMGNISGSSEKIGKIIKTIEDIAFQTNILALNAAVEAARAGEAGKGFAVVAEEVRNLATKSAEASKNTSALIEDSIKAVDEGTRIADSTADALMMAVEGAKKVRNAIDRISQSSKEQAESIAQVTNGMDQISDVVQNNSATAQESAAASEELSDQAQLLKELVGKFKLLDSGPGISIDTREESFHQLLPSEKNKSPKKDKRLPLKLQADKY